MNGLVFLLLSCAACALLAGQGRHGDVGALKATPRGAGGRAGAPRDERDALPRMVRQVAALLSAGRTGPVLWSALGQVLAAEHGRGLPRDLQAGQPADTAAFPQATARATPAGAGPEATLLLIYAVERASALGLPTAVALRSACQVLGSGGRFQRGLTHQQKSMWLDMAACFEVCEASGAAVAQVLERFAATLEAEQDAAALRETVLAGPRATVRLLNWLPFLGLGLGMLMGVNPLAVLVSGPQGWLLLAVGLALVFAGRTWTARMMATAAQTPRANNTRHFRLRTAGPRAAAGRR